jgi:hypothetical protein
VVAYLIGFITCTIIYTMYSILWSLQRGIIQDSLVSICRMILKKENL